MRLKHGNPFPDEVADKRVYTDHCQPATNAADRAPRARRTGERHGAAAWPAKGERENRR